MCGIAGFLDARANGRNEQWQGIAGAMQEAIHHRGPDDRGTWIDAEAGVALAHLRLSIVDLSPAGHQPMTSADGRYVIVYNGEVYSHEPVRARLQEAGIEFRGHSDTEVILESIAAYGVKTTVDWLIGMFAIGVWDRKERTFTLIRDRLGIKPVYWAKFGSLFLFGSELKALRAHPGWQPRLDRASVAAYLRHNYVPAPRTIYEGVNKLEPGSILTLPWNGEPQIEKFWDARAIARAGVASPIAGDDTEMTDRLEALLQDAVKRRMMADVPLGAFLSGGIDSSTVVALMQRAGMGKTRTFSIGFDIESYDESHHAAAVARHLGTDHTELTVTAQQARDVIPSLPDIYDEPFADPSQIPTYLLSALTRKHVTVALSGDGGDELFAGYNRYQLARKFWGGISLLPRPVRAAIADGITSISPRQWSSVTSVLPKGLRYSELGDKMHKMAGALRIQDSSALYRRLVSNWEPSQAMPGTTEPQGLLWDDSVTQDFPDLLQRMQFLDLVTYLPDDILTKVDRASMAVALEARVPLIDHRVVEFAWHLPQHAKLRAGKSKWLLRQVLYRHVPEELVERPKMGFGVPIGEWLRGPLRDWAESLLDERRLRDAGLVDAAFVRRHWEEHQRGTRDWQYLLWGVLMLEAWRERWLRT